MDFDYVYHMDIWRLFLGFVVLCILTQSCTKRPNPSDYKDCTIYRDKWGVPHIHGKTDRDVAYGLAWAGCEDDFKTLQEQMLAINGRYGEVRGMDGVIADFAIHFMGIRDYARRHIDELDEATLQIVRGYVQGVNAYAALHPEELLLPDLFPTTDVDLVAGYMLGLVEISGAAQDLAKLADGSIVKELADEERGSNAIAISAKKTEEGQTFLAINSHQPMEGWYSWYEAHLISDEGMNILGGTFPGAATIFHGTNEHLGWAHTVNHADFSDVYQLTMHPDKPYYYKMDDQWLPLEKKVIKAWVKLAGPIKIPITRDIYKSEFGITFKVGDQFFAWRYQAGESVKAIEQWYKMNKASSWEEWKAALEIKGIPCTNIVYADKEDNIYFVSNARQPIRSNSINWKEIIDGQSSSSIWPDRYYPIDSLPYVLNPLSGFVFNTNNTPYSSSGDDDNPDYKKVQETMSFQTPKEENNRSLRFQELMDTVTMLSYDEFLEVKYDRTYPRPLRALPYNEEKLLTQDPNQNKELEPAIKLLNNWNRSTRKDNEVAALFLLAKDALYQHYRKNGSVDDEDFINAIDSASSLLMKSYGKLEVPLGDFQRHRRGDVDIPIGGGSDVIAAMYSRPDEDGKFKAFTGETYIQMVRFDSEKGPIIESVNAYGSSAEEDSEHFTDQMQLFADQNLKPMTLDLGQVKKEAVDSYHPKFIR